MGSDSKPSPHTASDKARSLENGVGAEFLEMDRRLQSRNAGNRGHAISTGLPPGSNVLDGSGKAEHVFDKTVGSASVIEDYVTLGSL